MEKAAAILAGIFRRGMLTREQKIKFSAEICFVNLTRARLFSAVLAVVFGALVAVDFINRSKGLWENPGYEGLFYIHAATAGVLVVSFFVIMIIMPVSADQTKLYHRLVVGVMGALIAVSSALTSVADQLIHGQISAYIVTVFALGVILLLGLWESVFLYGLSFAVFIAGITLVQKDANHLFGNYVNGTILTLVAWIFSRVIHAGRRRDFSHRATIEEQQASLSRQMEINRGLIQSLMDVSSELERSSAIMSGSSASFTGNIQSHVRSIEEMTASIRDVTARSENVDSIVNSQSAVMNSLMSKMEELDRIAREMEGTIRATLGRTADISARATSGEAYIGEMNLSMEEIRHTSEEMTGILGIINDISDRINLLSLNASIEAARAGEAGRGFAVVADEIGKLADQTSTSVKEIDSLIKKSEGETTKGMAHVHDTVSAMSGIISGVAEINQMINAISEQMKRHIASNEEVNRDASSARSRFNDIRSSTEEQKKSAQGIVETIGAIHRISQSNAGGAEDLLKLSTSIAEMAHNLKEKISLYTGSEK